MPTSDETKKYHVWWVINPPNKPTFTPVDSPEAGHKLIENEANRQLGIPAIWGNAFGLEVFEDGEWTEWYDEDGFDVDEAFENRRTKCTTNTVSFVIPVTQHCIPTSLGYWSSKWPALGLIKSGPPTCINVRDVGPK